MKKVMICALALAAAFAVKAQNKKGNLIVGTYVGGTGYSTSNYKSTYSYNPYEYKTEYKNFNIGIGPELGLYITDRLVLGTSLSISYNHSKNNSSSTASTNTSEGNSNNIYVSAGPSARLYLGKNNDKGMPFIWLGGGIGFYPSDEATYKNDPVSYEYTYKTKNYVTWNVGPRIGYEHFFSKAFGLQYYVGYIYSRSSYKYEYDYVIGGTDYTSKTKYSSGGINFGVGVLLHVERNKKGK